MKSVNPDVKKMTDLALLAYKGENLLVLAEIDRRKKIIKKDKLKLV